MRPYDTPNPGSPEAIDAGCTCPEIDNHYGEGIPCGEGVAFIYTLGCPVHDDD